VKRKIVSVLVVKSHMVKITVLRVGLFFTSVKRRACAFYINIRLKEDFPNVAVTFRRLSDIRMLFVRFSLFNTFRSTVSDP
jgi:hypothetical protein